MTPMPAKPRASPFLPMFKLVLSGGGARGVASIGVHIGSRPESPDPHGIHQAVILFVDHMYVSETKKEKMYKLVRHQEVAQGMHEGKYLGGPQQRQYHEDNGIRLQRYQECMMYTLTLNAQWPQRIDCLTRSGERQEEPKEQYETINDCEPN